jgi:hypothetical protein
VCLYAKLDRKLYYKDDLGLETVVSGVGGGGAVPVSWFFSTLTSGNPASTYLRFDNVTPLSVTEIIINTVDARGVDMRPLLQTLSMGDQVFLCTETSSNCKLYNISDNIDNTSYFSLTVSLESQSAPANFVNNETLHLIFHIQNNIFDQSLNTADSVTFDNVTVSSDIINSQLGLQYSTGVLTGGVVSAVLGSDEFSITAGSGLITNPTTGVYSSISWANIINQNISTLTPSESTHIFYFDDDSGVVKEQLVPASNSQRRDRVYIGGLFLDPTFAVIIEAGGQSRLVSSVGSSLQDLAAAIGIINLSGNVVTSVSVLTLIKTAGSLFSYGSNPNQQKSPHVVPNSVMDSDTGGDTFSIAYRSTTDPTALDFINLTASSVIPAQYDNFNGSASPGIVGNNQWAVMRYFITSGNGDIIMPGQQIYSSIDAAVAGTLSENFIVPTTLLANSVLIAYLVMRGNSADFSNDSNTRIIPASKFGSSGAGGSVSSMQDTYDNSSAPQIISNDSQGALIIKNAQTDEDALQFEIQNKVGGIVYSIDGLGNVDINNTLLLTHTADAEGDHGLEIDIVNPTGIADVKALDIVYRTGPQPINTEEPAIVVNLERTGALGGETIGLLISATEPANVSNEAIGIDIAPLVNPIRQTVGTFDPPSTGDITLDTSGSPTTESISTLGTNTVDVWANDDDFIIVSDSASFQSIELLFDSFAEEKKDMQYTFEYQASGTSPLYTSFSPVDTTNSGRNNGNILWLVADTPNQVSASGVFNIKIIRNRGGGGTVTPIISDDGVLVSTGVLVFGWDKNADVSLNSVGAVEYKQGGDAGIIVKTERGGSDNYIISTSSDSLTTGICNVLIGTGAGESVSGGSNNTLIGCRAGKLINFGNGNVIFGFDSAPGITTGSNNVFLGPNTKGVTNGNNQICIGNGAVSTASNTCVIGALSMTTLRPMGVLCDLGTSLKPFKDLHLSGYSIQAGLPRAIIVRNAVQSITSSSLTNVFFNNNSLLVGMSHDVITNSDRLVADVAGLYNISYQMIWDTSTTNLGLYRSYITVNGGTQRWGMLERSATSSDASFVILNTATFNIELAADDYITISVFQNSGTSRTISSASNTKFMQLSAFFIA